MEQPRPNFKLTIDQVSRLTGVKKGTLRYWEKSFGDFLQPTRTDSQRREYSMADLEIIDSIKKLLEEEHLTKRGVRIHLESKTAKLDKSLTVQLKTGKIFFRSKKPGFSGESHSILSVSVPGGLR